MERRREDEEERKWEIRTVRIVLFYILFLSRGQCKNIVKFCLVDVRKSGSERDKEGE